MVFVSKERSERRPHDRSVIVAWRPAPPGLAEPGSWLRIRFSVTTALVKESGNYDRSAVLLHTWLLEPLAPTTLAGGAQLPRTRLTCWGVEELPPGLPDWLTASATRKATRATLSFSQRLSKWLHLDATEEYVASLPAQVPADWLSESAARPDDDKHKHDDQNDDAEDEDPNQMETEQVQHDPLLD